MPWWKNPTKDQKDSYKRGEHVMNKPEAAAMRRIQSETGKTEEEVRAIKKYREMLSDAQLDDKSRETKEWRRDYLQKREKEKELGINSKWNFGSIKAMFKQKTMQVLNGDKETTDELYKRYAGGLVDDKRPKAFFYRNFGTSFQSETEVMQAIAKTDGQFVYSPDRNEVGFMHEASLTVFSLVYQVK